MATNVPDEAFARYIAQMGAVTAEQIEAARAVQAEKAKHGVQVSLGDVLVEQGLLAPATRENIERKLQSQQPGGVRQLGNYKLLKKLGEGGMGAVYLAEDTMLGRQVALKVLPKKFTESPEFLARFNREAKAAGKLNHPNIVGAYAVGEEQGHHYYVMEYCEGETLDAPLKRQKCLAETQVLDVAIQVVQGLKYAHEHGIIHRDIKPANIFLTKDGVAKVLDLGLSKNVAEGEKSFQTVSGTALGTPHYISPEQAQAAKDIDGRTDMYSLGATMYHLLTGDTPFHASTAAAVLLKHITVQLPDPRDIRPELSEGVVHIVTKAMAKSPADRYAHMGEMLEDLERVKAGEAPSSAMLDAAHSSIAMRAPSTRAGEGRDERAARVRGEGAAARATPGARRTGGQQPVAPRRARATEGDAGQDEAPAPAKRALGLYLGIGGGAVVLLGILLAFALSGGPEPEKPKADRASAPTGTVDKGETAKTPSPGPTAVTKPPEAPKSLEEAASAAFDKLTRFEGLAADNTAGRIASVEAFLKEYGTTILAARARVLLEELKKGPAQTPPPTPVVQPAIPPVPQPTPTAVDSPERWKNAVDLLALVDPQKDVAVGQWTRQAVGWRPDTTNRGVLEFPYRPSEEYDLKVVFSRDAGTFDIGQVLSKGGRSFKWQMWHAPDETRCGFEMIKGVTALDAANSTVRLLKPPIENARRYASIVQVRNDGLKAYLDGRLVSEWKTDYSDLSIFGNARLRDETLLGLTTMAAKGTVHEAQVLEVTGKGTFTRPNDPAAKEAERKRAGAQAGSGALARELPLDLGGGVRMDFVLVPAGKFLMGSNSEDVRAVTAGGASARVTKDLNTETPQHEVTISRPFYLGVFEVTQAQYAALMGGNPSKTKGDTLPVESASWDNAVEFCNRLSAKTGRQARLPTEAEWEYACRAGTTTLFHFGNDAAQLNEYGVHSIANGPQPVGKKKPNAFGLYDMHGNVWEMCADWFADSYANAMAVDPQGPLSGTYRVNRGGGWFAEAMICRSAMRGKGLPAPGNPYGGFRVALDAGAQGRQTTLDLGGGVKVELVLIPAGTFTMGCPDNEPGLFVDRGEGPQHEVTITKPFYMGKYEVTVPQFRRFAESATYQTECERAGNKGVCMDNAQWKELTGVNWMKPNYAQDDSYPACLLTWNDAQAFVSWASKATGKTVRLPTEAEWEYACRAGSTTRFHTGPDDSDLDKAGWHGGNSGMKPHPVGQKASNAWGLYDMHGNVWEWCEDWHDKGYYNNSPRTDPPGPATGTARVPRGGCFHGLPRDCRSGERGAIRPDLRITANGFRLVVAAGAPAVAQPATKDQKPEALLPKEVSLDLGGGAKMQLVLVPAGEFMMGDDGPEAAPAEKPAHKVKISKPYYIGKGEVTVAQFAAFVNATRYQTDCEKAGDRGTVPIPTWGEKAGINWTKPGFAQGPNHPVVLVSWNDADAFCKWASKAGRPSASGFDSKGPVTVRLPTEAEWEYASRGPEGRKYPWGDTWDGARANHGDVSLKKASQTQGATTNDNDGFPYTAPVGSYKTDASWCGAHDLAGNVTEWCADRFSATYYAQSPAVDPKGPATGVKRVSRPGCWFDGNPATACRSARRLGHMDPDDRHTGVGFRVVLDVPPKAP